METKILKTFVLSKERILTIDAEWDVFIRDEVNNQKKAFFTGSRFAKFLLSVEDINRSVAKTRDGKDVSVKLHLGSGWFLSLTPKISCVDLRKFFQHRDSSIRPSRLGIALTYGEWDALMDAAATINSDFDGFKACSPCWHATDEQLEKCCECTPFKSSAPHD